MTAPPGSRSPSRSLPARASPTGTPGPPSGTPRSALVPAGYGDGVPRHAGNRAEVWIDGVRRPVRGRICMDQFVVDLGGGPPAPGGEVVLFGPGVDGEPTAQDWAEACDTISYEIVTGSAAVGCPGATWATRRPPDEGSRQDPRGRRRRGRARGRRVAARLVQRGREISHRDVGDGSSSAACAPIRSRSWPTTGSRCTPRSTSRTPRRPGPRPSGVAPSSRRPWSSSTATRSTSTAGTSSARATAARRAVFYDQRSHGRSAARPTATRRSSSSEATSNGSSTTSPATSRWC